MRWVGKGCEGVVPSLNGRVPGFQRVFTGFWSPGGLCGASGRQRAKWVRRWLAARYGRWAYKAGRAGQTNKKEVLMEAGPSPLNVSFLLSLSLSLSLVTSPVEEPIKKEALERKIWGTDTHTHTDIRGRKIEKKRRNKGKNRKWRKNLTNIKEKKPTRSHASHVFRRR